MLYTTPHFRPSEFACNCGCGGNVKQELISKLQTARDIAGVPFVITSGFRCEEYNERVKGTRGSAHTLGVAADISCEASGVRFPIIKALLASGFSRIGIAKNFIHADISTEHPQRVIWLY